MSSLESPKVGNQLSMESEEQLLADNVGLVLLIAGKFTTLAASVGLEFEDIKSAGNLGLLLAIRRYDSSRGMFSSFAFPYVRGLIMQEINRHRWGHHADWSGEGPRMVPMDTAAYLARSEERSPLDKVIAEETSEEVREAMHNSGEHGNLIYQKYFIGLTPTELREGRSNYGITRKLHAGFEKMRQILKPGFHDDLEVKLSSVTRMMNGG